MIDFQYAGTATDGKPCQGSIRAPSAEAARLRLIGQGITPVSLQGGDAAAAAMAAAKSEEVRLKRADILLFTRELSHLKSANMPLDRALVMLQEIANNDRLKAFVIRVTEGVRSGKSLYISLQPFERDLGRRYLVMIRAGEASGSPRRISGLPSFGSSTSSPSNSRWSITSRQPGGEVVDHGPVHDRIHRTRGLPEDHPVQRLVLALRDHLVLSPSVHRQDRRRRRPLAAGGLRRRPWRGRWTCAIPMPLGLRRQAAKQVMPSTPGRRRVRPGIRRRAPG